MIAFRNRIGRAAAVAVLALGIAAPAPVAAQDRGAAALGQLIAGLGVTARVLMIGAHPDDEDTQLIAWLARGRHVETAYLSLTRGDGGQNLIGNELGEGLGVIRTEELLAARRIDGAHQFFTRAYDFGFSKSAEETYRHWPRDSILRDVVTVVRGFKPHVIVAVFSGTPRDGHGHHQVAGMLAREAFDLASDTIRFPPRFTAGLSGWTATHFYRGQRGNATGATYGVNVGEYSPLLGRSYAEIAGDSRSQHKSQGFGVLQRKGVQMDYVRREASRLRTTEGTATPLFEGVDTTFARFYGAFAPAGRARLDSVRNAIAEARRVYDAFDPSAVIAPLATVARNLDALCPPDLTGEVAGPGVHPCGVPSPSAAASVAGDLAQTVALARERLYAAMTLAAGVAVEATASRELWAEGRPVPVDVRIYNRGGLPMEVQGGAVRFPGTMPGASMPADAAGRVLPDSMVRFAVDVPATQPMSPWWLARPRVGDLFAMQINGRPESRHLRTGSARLRLGIAGTTFEVSAPVVYRYADPVAGEVERPVSIVPAASVTLDRATELAPEGADYNRMVQVNVVSSLADTQSVRVGLRLPVGLTADSVSRTVKLAPGASTTLTFRLRGRPAAGVYEIAAELSDASASVATASAPSTSAFRTGYQLIEYPHIRPQRMYRPATVALRVADISVPRNLRVTYVPGISDNVAPVLQQLGFALSVVQPTALDTFDLSATDVVVVGPRAYEAHDALVRNNARLLAWVQRGGTMVVQYGQYEMMNPGVMPFPVTIQRPHDRVTEEDAPVRVLDPGSPVLSSPNRITSADFAGWVQERGLYMPRTFADAYKPLLSMNDPGESPNSGGILVAPYGSGTYVYTTLSFFRQLPAGVPGATRLFVNLLAAGQTPRPTVP